MASAKNKRAWSWPILENAIAARNRRVVYDFLGTRLPTAELKFLSCFVLFRSSVTLPACWVYRLVLITDKTWKVLSVVPVLFSLLLSLFFLCWPGQPRSLTQCDFLQALTGRQASTPYSGELTSVMWLSRGKVQAQISVLQVIRCAVSVSLTTSLMLCFLSPAPILFELHNRVPTNSKTMKVCEKVNNIRHVKTALVKDGVAQGMCLTLLTLASFSYLGLHLSC